MPLKRHRVETHKYSICLVLEIESSAGPEGREAVVKDIWIFFLFFPVITQVNITASVIVAGPIYCWPKTKKKNKRKEIYSLESAFKLSCLLWTYFDGYIGRAYVPLSLYFQLQSSETSFDTHTELEIVFPTGCLQMTCNSVIFTAAAPTGLWL